MISRKSAKAEESRDVSKGPMKSQGSRDVSKGAQGGRDVSMESMEMMGGKGGRDVGGQTGSRKAQDSREMSMESMGVQGGRDVSGGGGLMRDQGGRDVTMESARIPSRDLMYGAEIYRPEFEPSREVPQLPPQREPNKFKPTEDEIKNFDDSLKDVIAEQSEELEMLLDIPQIHHALFQHEIIRLEDKLGKDHPRVRHLRTSLDRNQDIITSLTGEMEGSARVQKTPVRRDSIVFGRVLDEKMMGVGDLSVNLENEDGMKIPFLETVMTDGSGNFSLPIDEENITKLNRGIGGTGHLVVRDKKGVLQHKDPAPFSIAPGEQMSMNISVIMEKQGLFRTERKSEISREVSRMGEGLLRERMAGQSSREKAPQEDRGFVGRAASQPAERSPQTSPADMRGRSQEETASRSPSKPIPDQKEEKEKRGLFGKKKKEEPKPEPQPKPESRQERKEIKERAARARDEERAAMVEAARKEKEEKDREKEKHSLFGRKSKTEEKATPSKQSEEIAGKEEKSSRRSLRRANK